MQSRREVGVSATHLAHGAVLFAGWLLMYAVFLGWGLFLVHLLQLALPRAERYYAPAWLGWAFSLFFFSLANLFLPLTYGVTLAFAFPGLFYLARFRPKGFLRPPGKTAWSGLLLPLCLFALIAVWTATQAMLAPDTHDSGLYHFNSIRWLNECPAVFGLGNLHGRLAFNQSFFGYVAALNLYPFFGRGYHLANSFLVILLAAHCLGALRPLSRYLGRRALPPASVSIRALLLPALILIMATAPLSSPTPDVAGYVLHFLLFIYLVSYLESRPGSGKQQALVALLLILATAAVTVKLSNAYYALAIVLIAAWRWRRSRSPGDTRWRAAVGGSLVLATLLLCTWMVRGVISSGYPLFPSTIGRVERSWTMPQGAVRWEADEVYRWARWPGGSRRRALESWDWLAPWARSIIYSQGGLFYVVYPAGLALVFFGLVFCIGLIRPGRIQRPLRQALLCSLPVLAALLAWFFTAPAIRFAIAFFFLLPPAAFFCLAALLGWRPGRKTSLPVLLIPFLALNAHVLAWFMITVASLDFPPAGGFQPIPRADLELQRTTKGLEVWIPVEGAQVWDSPLPATPYFDPGLRRLGPGRCAGFAEGSRAPDDYN